MRIGVLSDTHGHVERTEAATRALIGAGAEILVHCGDIGSEPVLFEMAALVIPAGIPAYAVLGNVDLHDPRLLHFPEEAGIVVRRRLEIELDERTCAVIHGDDARALIEAIDSGAYAWIFTGHTHVPSDETHGQTRVINPGAVYRASEPGMALFDTRSGELTRMAIG